MWALLLIAHFFCNIFRGGWIHVQCSPEYFYNSKAMFDCCKNSWDQLVMVLGSWWEKKNTEYCQPHPSYKILNTWLIRLWVSHFLPESLIGQYFLWSSRSLNELEKIFLEWMVPLTPSKWVICTSAAEWPVCVKQYEEQCAGSFDAINTH